MWRQGKEDRSFNEISTSTYLNFGSVLIRTSNRAGHGFSFFAVLSAADPFTQTYSA